MTDLKNEKRAGYRQPPISNRFQKGQSGNPKGRPKKLTSAARIANFFNQQHDATIQGKKHKLPLVEALTLKAIDSVFKGNAKAARAISKIVEQAALKEATSPDPVVTIRHEIITTSLYLSKIGGLREIDGKWKIESWLLEEALARRRETLSGLHRISLFQNVVDKEGYLRILRTEAARRA